jgi:hypothetical protein
MGTTPPGVIETAKVSPLATLVERGPRKIFESLPGGG